MPTAAWRTGLGSGVLKLRSRLAQRLDADIALAASVPARAAVLQVQRAIVWLRHGRAADLLALDGAPGETGAVNRVFRAFHTLKGSALGVGACRVAVLAGALETALRAGDDGAALALGPALAEAVRETLALI